jgi:hypothetical protein
MKNLLVIAAAATALSGCAGMITGGELIRPGEPTARIRVENYTSGPVNAVLISACSASTYGLNRLPSGVSIPPGRSYDFTVSAGCWDVAAGTVGVGDARERMQLSPGMTFRYGVGDPK